MSIRRFPDGKLRGVCDYTFSFHSEYRDEKKDSFNLLQVLNDNTYNHKPALDIGLNNAMIKADTHYSFEPRSLTFLITLETKNIDYLKISGQHFLFTVGAMIYAKVAFYPNFLFNSSSFMMQQYRLIEKYSIPRLQTFSLELFLKGLPEEYFLSVVSNLSGVLLRPIC